MDTAASTPELAAALFTLDFPFRGNHERNDAAASGFAIVNATGEAAPRRFNERRLLFQSLALGASALHLIQATRYLLKHRPGAEGTDAADETTCGFVVETRIAKFKSRPPPIPPVPVRIDSSALQTRRDSSAVASVAARRESTAVPSRRESSVAYPEYL
ncbi:hypothetical protein HPB52_012326 [Rhipicephalus sanguineus]|uniref:Uncharacterized protein n=1 Tax=Rhipicephalus sanguineus TaxID=34632 RepID=A0A9D4YP39_RHISA|nr:hypothetical protein HPB52_012326 [Rhipicephalus sanguineus]